MTSAKDPRRLSNVIGIDDGPFDHAHRGDVPVVGAVFAGPRFDGVVIGRARRDGADATRRLTEMVAGSRFAEHLQLVLLDGVAVAGFNVIDVAELSRRLAMPVLVVCRRQPDLARIRAALLERVPGGRRKWGLIERLGAMEPVAGVWVQRAGLDLDAAGVVVRRFAVHGRLPEPLRVAHLIAGAVATGESRGGA